jgi:signal transduction histidine kinase
MTLDGPDRAERSLDLRVRATPIHLPGGTYVIVAIKDIGDEKRRRALERIFFHDALNTAGGVRSLSEAILEDDRIPDDAREMLELVRCGATQLVDEIESQRTLASAESGDLVVRLVEVDLLEVLRRVESIYRHHVLARGRPLVIDPASSSRAVRTDPPLLARVVGNMVKNALEAIDEGKAVTIGCRGAGDTVEVSVHNPAFIPVDVQLQIFARSFSTKGPDRGLGTYSMKLLVERYLGGSVSFTSKPEEGTTFTARLPAGGPPAP